MSSSRLLAGCLVAAVLVTSPAKAQNVEQNPRVRQAIRLLEIWLDAQRDYEQIPGLSVAVVHDQDVVWKGAYGFADLAKKTPASPDTIYSICSISKLFTSIAVMQQRDAGKLRLDDPVAKHLPWFTIKRTDPDGPEITIEGLLTHSSGLPREAAPPVLDRPGVHVPRTRADHREGEGAVDLLHRVRPTSSIPTSVSRLPAKSRRPRQGSHTPITCASASSCRSG